jgi:hypothetical protein
MIINVSFSHLWDLPSPEQHVGGEQDLFAWDEE